MYANTPVTSPYDKTNEYYHGETKPLTRPFSDLEKLLLIGFLITAFVPYPFNSVLNLFEIVIMVYVLLSPFLGFVLRWNGIYLFFLSISIIIGQLTGTSGWAEKTATLAFLKICTYMCFIVIIAWRCRNKGNRYFFLKWIVLPISVGMCISVYFDLYTNTRFFSEYHLRFTQSEAAIDVFEQQAGGAVEFFDYRNAGAGLALRPWQVPAWAICGVIALLTLNMYDQIRKSWFLVLITFLVITPLLLPQRNSIVTVGSTLAVYLFTSREPTVTKRRIAIIVFIILGFIIYYMLQPILVDSSNVNTALSKLLSNPLGDFDHDPRVNIFKLDVQWMLENPLILFFGTGWNIVIAPSVKPHNVIIAIVIASGLVGLLILWLFLRHQIADHIGNREWSWRHVSPAARAGLISLLATGMTDNYLTSRLSVPASFMALWIALCMIAVRMPEYDKVNLPSLGNDN